MQNNLINNFGECMAVSVSKHLTIPLENISCNNTPKAQTSDNFVCALQSPIVSGAFHSIAP